jgi:hypothetical protein
MNVLSSSNSFQQLAAPSLETIDPTFHGVLIPAQHLDGKFATPTIIAEWLHRRRLQFLHVLPIQNLTSDLIMAIGKNIGLHKHCLSNNALDGEPAAIDLRRNVLNYDPASPVYLLFGHGCKLSKLQNMIGPH